MSTAEIDEPDIQLELQDFKSELKQTFQEVLTDVKDAFAVEAKPAADRVLKFLRKSDSLNISAELIFAGDEITIYGSLNGKNYKERIYYDAGELVREIAFVDSKLGSTDFIYRRYP